MHTNTHTHTRTHINTRIRTQTQTHIYIHNHTTRVLLKLLSLGLLCVCRCGLPSFAFQLAAGVVDAPEIHAALRDLIDALVSAQLPPQVHLQSLLRHVFDDEPYAAPNFARARAAPDATSPDAADVRAEAAFGTIPMPERADLGDKDLFFDDAFDGVCPSTWEEGLRTLYDQHVAFAAERVQVHATHSQRCKEGTYGTYMCALCYPHRCVCVTGSVVLIPKPLDNVIIGDVVLPGDVFQGILKNDAQDRVVSDAVPPAGVRTKPIELDPRLLMVDPVRAKIHADALLAMVTGAAFPAGVDVPPAPPDVPPNPDAPPLDGRPSTPEEDAGSVHGSPPPEVPEPPPQEQLEAAIAQQLKQLEAADPEHTSLVYTARARVVDALKALRRGCRCGELIAATHVGVLFSALPRNYQSAVRLALQRRNSKIADYNPVLTALQGCNTAVYMQSCGTTAKIAIFYILGT